jgi:hypothetical protein
MQNNNSVYLAEGIVIGAALILLAALVIALSPLLWHDQLYRGTTLPAGCSVQVTPFGASAYPIAHCPFWVNF